MTANQPDSSDERLRWESSRNLHDKIDSSRLQCDGKSLEDIVHHTVPGWQRSRYYSDLQAHCSNRNHQQSEEIAQRSVGCPSRRITLSHQRVRENHTLSAYLVQGKLKARFRLGLQQSNQTDKHEKPYQIIRKINALDDSDTNTLEYFKITNSRNTNI